MSASDKPTEKLFKSFLAVVLAISFCPLMPADKAQAEEAGDSAGPADAAQMSDEGLGGDADPTEGALAADNSDADSELVGENNGAEDESATDDSVVALQAASDSKTPIVDWTECGTCQWMIDAGGCLIIEPQSGETGELEDWTGSEAPWLKYKRLIISATIKKTVTAKTASKAFYECESLQSTDLSGLDTSSVTDMTDMFYGCSKLASLDVSSFDTSSVTDMGGMFHRCSSLKSLDPSSLDTSSVTGMSSMFDGCSKLASLDLSSFDTSSVTDMFGMFCGCSSLSSLDVSSFDTSSVTSMGNMFYECSSLKSLDLSSFDTSNVISMHSGYNYHPIWVNGGMFSGCSKLASLDLSSFDTSNVTDMTDMFYDCSSLTSLDLSSFDTSSVTDMGGMFHRCSSLTSLDLSSFDTSSVKGQPGYGGGMGSMFSGCSSLTSLDLSSFDTSNVTRMGGMFSGCSSLSSIDLGQEFAFEGAGLDRQCSLPTPRGDRLTGRWVSSADGMAYAPDDIPSNTAATYTAQVAAFTDVDYSDTSWYGDAVSYVAERGLITGYTDGVKAGQFGVGDVLTRAQLATILWRNACPDEYASYDPETAVDTTGIDGSADGMYYTAAANWAVRNGVITGFDREDGSKDFAADDDVSFEQLITILSRLCSTSEELDAAGTDLSAFADGDLASSWSRGAFAWAAAKGLVQGYDEPTGKYLMPGDPVARERVAVVLMRAFEMGIMK